MRIILIVNVFILISCDRCFSQEFFTITKEMIKEKQIYEIQLLSSETYIFDSIHNYRLKYKKDTPDCSYNYNKSGHLQSIEILHGGNHYWEYVSFGWENNLLLESITIEESNGRCDNGIYGRTTTISNLVRYNYSNKGKLLSYIALDIEYDYGIDCDGLEWGNIPKGDLYAYFYAFKKEKNRKYFLYDKKEMLIAYFPAKEYSNYYNDLDLIYSYNMLNQIQAKGFGRFKEKYLQGEVLKKVIDDCYTQVENEQLLINGKPIKEFLADIGKADVRYIVFEVADNYFLFYKII